MYKYQLGDVRVSMILRSAVDQCAIELRLTFIRQRWNHISCMKGVSLHILTFGDHLVHLAYHVDNSKCKTTFNYLIVEPFHKDYSEICLVLHICTILLVMIQSQTRRYNLFGMSSYCSTIRFFVAQPYL